MQQCFLQQDDGRKSIAQPILQKSTDFLRPTIAPIEGQGGVTLSYVRSNCHSCPFEDFILLGASRAREEAEQLVVRGVRWVVRLEEPERSIGYTGQHGPQRGECFVLTPGRVVREPHVITQALGKSAGPAQVLVEGLQERSRLKMMEERTKSRWTTTRPSKSAT